MFGFIPWFEIPSLKIPGTEFGIHPFGVLVAVCIFVGMHTAERRARATGGDPFAVRDCATHVVVIGLGISYVVNAIVYVPEFADDPLILFKKYTGLSSLAGFFGAIVGFVIWRLRRKHPSLPVADAIAYGFPFGWIFGRLGCFVAHDHPGNVTDFFLAVADYRTTSHPHGGPPRHDLGLYEMIWAVGIAALFAILARRPRPVGFFAALLPMSYAPIRFLLDFLRAPAAQGGDPRWGPLTPSQFGCVALFLIGAALWFRIRAISRS